MKTPKPVTVKLPRGMDAPAVGSPLVLKGCQLGTVCAVEQRRVPGRRRAIVQYRSWLAEITVQSEPIYRGQLVGMVQRIDGGEIFLAVGKW